MQALLPQGSPTLAIRPGCERRRTYPDGTIMAMGSTRTQPRKMQTCSGPSYGNFLGWNALPLGNV